MTFLYDIFTCHTATMRIRTNRQANVVQFSNHLKALRLSRASLKVNSPIERVLRGRQYLPLNRICTCRRQRSPSSWPQYWLAASKICSVLLMWKRSLKARLSPGFPGQRLNRFASKFRPLESGRSCDLLPTGGNKDSDYFYFQMRLRI